MKLTKVKSVKHATLFKDEKDQPYIRLECVRQSYCFAGHPSEDKDDDGNVQKKFRTVAMLPKKTHLAAKELVKEVIQGIIKKEGVKIPVANWFLADGDDKEDENMQGHWLVSCSDGKYAPKARDGDGNLLTDRDEIDEMFKSGYWAHVLIRPWYFNGKTRNSTKTFPKRVAAGFTAITFYEKDEVFAGAGRVDDDEAWDDVPKGKGGSGRASSRDDEDEEDDDDSI